MAVSEPVESAASEDSEDLLELDTEGAAPRALARLGLLTLAVAGVTFVVSIVLASFPSGSVLDFVVFIAWLAVGVLGLGGTALLLMSGLLALMDRSRAS